MIESSGKQVVCITGTVWTQGRNAPRKLLVKEGFVRPTWFTTGHGITDAEYQHVSDGQFHQASANDEVLVQMRYGSDHIGILKQDFQDALAQSQIGILVVGPQEIVAQIAKLNQRTVIFVLVTEFLELSHHLTDADLGARLHRLDVAFDHVDAWTEVYTRMLEVLGLDKR